MCRLALTVGEASLTSMLQVILLLSGSYVAHLDMPPICGLPEGKAASQLPPTTVLLAFLNAYIPWAAPSLPVSERCCWYQPRELSFRLMFKLQRVGSDHPEASERFLCKFHLQLLVF